MGIFAKIKSSFGSKTGKAMSNRPLPVAGGDNEDYTRSLDNREPFPQAHGNPRVEQPPREEPPVQCAWSLWSVSPETGKKFYRGDDFATRDDAHNNALLGSGIPGSPGEYLDLWPSFDGDYTTNIQDLGSSLYGVSEASNAELDTPPSFGLFAPRKGGYRAGHVEELETSGLKRSNAIRKKSSPSKILAKYADEDQSSPRPAARPLSWMLPVHQPMPPCEEHMACVEQPGHFLAADGEVEFIRADSTKPCPIREATMRKATLARLEGRR
ncbi:hypothetical protein SLS60_009622 [Paraconiothyrium brasiliense]|uniref:Uncharacterized protein n=1 Tax=Paraconiothyrium brasiliense TaxID=300254 RepID=A0ABR3QVY2_9PLEO